MAVLLDPDYTDERGNAVALTETPVDALEDSLSINVQRGEEAVVSPAPDFFVLRKPAQEERSAARSAGRVRSANPQAEWLRRMRSGRDVDGYPRRITPRSAMFSTTPSDI